MSVKPLVLCYQVHHFVTSTVHAEFRHHQFQSSDCEAEPEIFPKSTIKHAQTTVF